MLTNFFFLCGEWNRSAKDPVPFQRNFFLYSSLHANSLQLTKCWNFFYFLFLGDFNLDLMQFNWIQFDFILLYYKKKGRKILELTWIKPFNSELVPVNYWISQYITGRGANFQWQNGSTFRDIFKNSLKWMANIMWIEWFLKWSFHHFHYCEKKIYIYCIYLNKAFVYE